jgi:hypothetical protein
MFKLLYPLLHIGKEARLVPEPVWTWWQREKFLLLPGIEVQFSIP